MLHNEWIGESARRDCDNVGLRRRRVHDVRGTGIFLAVEDGAEVHGGADAVVRAEMLDGRHAHAGPAVSAWSLDGCRPPGDDDGADKDILRRGTHQPPKDVMELYTTVPNRATVHAFRRKRLRGRWVQVLGAVHGGRR